MERQIEHFPEPGVESEHPTVDVSALALQEGTMVRENTERREQGKAQAVRDRLFAKARTYLLLTFMAAGVAGEAQPVFAQAEHESSINNPEQSKDISSRKRTAYEYIKHVIEANHLREAVGFLRDTFGAEVDDFLSYSHVRDAIQFTDEVTARVTRGDSTDLEDTGFQNTGSTLAWYYGERGWSPLAVQEKENSSNPLVVTGFDTLGVDGNTQVQQELEKKYSKFWLGNSTRDISFQAKDSVMTIGDQKYQLLGLDAVKVGIAALMEDDPRPPIKLYPATLEMPGAPSIESLKDKIIDVLNHEIGHSNDWEASHTLNTPDRIMMFREVAERYLSTDRFFSEYVESTTTDPDPHKQLKRRVQEYWAELTRNYFGVNQEKFIKEYPKDASVVAKWYAKATH